LVDALTGAVISSYRPTRFTDRRQTDPSHRNMMEVSIGKYCQFIILFTKYWENIITYILPRILGDRPHASPPEIIRLCQQAYRLR